jgi:hypothetical protein
MTRNWLLAVMTISSAACVGEGGFSVPDMNDPDIPDTENCRPSDIETIYVDSDGDGFGDPSNSAEDCELPPGFVTNAADCDDSEPLAYEGATDFCGDKIDNDCAGGDICVDSLTGEWVFAETSGLITADESGNLMAGTLQGGLIHNPGRTLLFDGSDDYVEVPTAEMYELSAGTISLWFMPTLPGVEQAIISKDANGNGAGGHFSIYYDTDGSVRARLQSNNETYEVLSPPVAANTWHHVAFSFGGNEGMSLFVDDIAGGIDPYTGGTVRNVEPLVIGAGTDNSQAGSAEPINKAFAGEIAAVNIYTRQLLRTEITSLKLVSDPRTSGL